MRPNGRFIWGVPHIRFNMAFINNTVDRSTRTTAGASLDITDRSTQCYLGAAIVGGAVIVTSVGVTTIAAPAVTLVPIAGAVALGVAGNHIRDNATTETTTEPAAA